MAHLAGVSTSPSNFMVAIYNFATTNGWVGVRTNGATSAGFATGHTTSTAQSSFYDPGAVLPGVERAQINMVTHDTPAGQAVIRFCPSTGDSGALAEFWTHTGSPAASNIGTETTQMGQADFGTPSDLGFGGSHVGYHLYTSTNPDGSRYLHGWVEGTTGTFWHFALGTFVKSGAYGGGQYVDAAFANTSPSRARGPFQANAFGSVFTKPWCRMDDSFADGTTFPGGWQKLDGWAYQTTGSSSFRRNFIRGYYYGGANSFNLRTPLGPIYHPFKQQAVTTAKWKPMGHLQDMRLVSMENLEAKAQITLGTDVWDIIPCFRKGVEINSNAMVRTGSGQTITTNQQGYAYRRVVP